MIEFTSYLGVLFRPPFRFLSQDIINTKYREIIEVFNGFADFSCIFSSRIKRILVHLCIPPSRGVLWTFQKSFRRIQT